MATMGCIYATVDLGDKLHVSRALLMAPPPSALGGYPNSTLSLWDFDADHQPVQVIQTRFMQLQPNLLALGEARLRIFETFCLPSILIQSSKKFLWLIRTDPDLHPTLKKPLLAMVQSYPNIILIGSNENPEGFRLHASVEDITPRTVWSGSYELVQRYHNEAQSRIVIETRLDADDALHFGFVEYAEAVTIEEMASPETDWMIYCAYKHLEWHHENPFRKPMKESNIGFIVGVNQRGCITPGLSFVYGLQVTRNDMPKGAHSQLHKATPFCNDEIKSHCIRHSTELQPAALRARTPTSAGMLNVVIGNQGKNLLYSPAESDADVQNEIWTGVRTTFGIEQEKVQITRRSLNQHLRRIVSDNLKGQCTKGHSCKKNSKHALKELLTKTVRK